MLITSIKSRWCRRTFDPDTNKESMIEGGSWKLKIQRRLFKTEKSNTRFIFTFKNTLRFMCHTCNCCWWRLGGSCHNSNCSHCNKTGRRWWASELAQSWMNGEKGRRWNHLSRAWHVQCHSSTGHSRFHGNPRNVDDVTTNYSSHPCKLSLSVKPSK